MIFLVNYGLSMTDTLFYKQNTYRDTIKAYEKQDKEDLKIVFFGNSHSYSSFDPRILEVELGIHSINMASAAQKLITTKVVADIVLKETTPDLAVVNLFAASFDESDVETLKSTHLLAMDFLPFSWEKLISIAEIFPINEWPEALSETYRLHRNWSKLKPVNKPYPFKKEQDYYQGFYTTKNTYGADMYASFKAKYEKQDSIIEQLTPKEKKRIDNLIETFKKNEIPVLFVNAPSEVYDMSDFNKTHALAVEQYIKGKGEHYLEFNKIKDSLGFTKGDYRNPNHLNTNGSIKASLYLSEFIRDSLKMNFEIGNLNLSGNRYAQAMLRDRTSFRQELDSFTTKKLFGIEEAILYTIEGNRHEILFPTAMDTLGFQKVRLEHDANHTEHMAYGDQKVFFNRDSTKIIFWGTLGTKDIVKYKDKNFAVFPFTSPLKKLRNLSFHAGKERRVTVFRIDTLHLDY